MTEPIKISTEKYLRDGKVDIDGKIWSVKLPGAATELRLGQSQRRLNLIEKKIESGNYNEEDLDKADSLEQEVMNIMLNIFQDGTADNSEVNKWFREKPMSIIIQVFEDIKKATEKINARESTEPPKAN